MSENNDRFGTEDDPAGFETDDFGATESHVDEEGSSEPDTLPSHIAAALTYLMSFATGVVFLVLEPEDRDVRFHAFQSILLGAVGLILHVGIFILGWIPPLGFFLGEILRWIVGCAWVAISIFLMVKAFGGERYQLPYLGPRAQKLANPY